MAKLIEAADKRLSGSSLVEREGEMSWGTSVGTSGPGRTPPPLLAGDCTSKSSLGYCSAAGCSNAKARCHLDVVHVVLRSDLGKRKPERGSTDALPGTPNFTRASGLHPPIRVTSLDVDYAG